MLLGDGARSSVVGEMLERVNPAEIGAFYEREMPRLVLFVTVSTGLDIHTAADVAQAAFEKALPRWPTLHNPRAWLYPVAQTRRSPGARRCAARFRSTWFLTGRTSRPPPWPRSCGRSSGRSWPTCETSRRSSARS